MKGFDIGFSRAGDDTIKIKDESEHDKDLNRIADYYAKERAITFRLGGF